ncbi:MAG TPA: VOC family protein [Symbiobacteriaceae bacterium]|nr:VOC family protein [Symbiobacteriaceae bacterium]
MVRLDRITIAVGDQARMVAFYGQLFQTTFTAIDCGSFTLHRGEVAPGLELQLCPKAVAGIAATQNIHQLRFVVPDLGRYLAAAVDAGGELLGAVTSEGGRRTGSLRDPDGNSLELIAEG